MPLSSLTTVSVAGEQLVFRAGDEEGAFRLGAELAHRWAKAIATPSPTLAKKLGISKSTRVCLIGDATSRELVSAIEEATAINEGEANLVLACVTLQKEVHEAVQRSAAYPGAPLWIIYPKGPGNEINERVVMDTLRASGWVDTKVASVSGRLTGLRFIQRGDQKSRKQNGKPRGKARLS